MPLKPDAYWRPFLKPPEILTPSAWAEKYRRLPRGQSALSDRYQNALSPYSRTIMDLCAVPGLSQLVIIKAAQIGASEALRNVIGWAAHLEPDPAGIVLPAESKGRDIFDNRILPLFRGTLPLRKLMTGRRSDIRKDQVKLANGFILHLMWSGSGFSLAADPMRLGICDETDKFPAWANAGQGEPVGLLAARLRTFGSRGLLVAASTPSNRFGRIWRLFDDCSIRAYFSVPCPHCGLWQRLVFDRLKYERGPTAKPINRAEHIRRSGGVWYECAGCKGRITEAQRAAMIGQGRYQTLPGEPLIRDAEGNRHDCLETVRSFLPGTSVGLQVSGLCCLWLSWVEIAAQYILAQGDLAKMFAFKTDTLGEPFDQQETRLRSDLFRLKSARAKLGEGVVPIWASALLATVDVQHRFFKIVVRAWGRSLDESSMESARVWHGRLERFEDLDALLAKEWPSEDAGRGRPMKITVLLIDTGGTRLGDEAISRTEQVNRWALSRQPFGVIPIKGTARRQNHADFIKRAKRVQHPGLEERLLDVHHFADELAWMVDKGRENPDEEVWHLNRRDDPEYNQELSNCVKVVERAGNKIDTAWRPVSDGATIDFFDCEVYQVAASYIAQERGPFPARSAVDAQRKGDMEAAQPAHSGFGEPLDAEETEFRRLREGRPDPNDAWTPTAYKL